MATLLSTAERRAQPGSYRASPTTSDKSKTWDLGVYPGGTTAELQSVNDFGVAMGWGDVPIEGGTEPRMIGVPLFGYNAGQWFESGVSSEDWTGDGGGISNAGIVAGNIMGSNGWPEAYAWVPNRGGFHLGRYAGDDGSAAIAISHSGKFIVGNSGKLLDDGTMRVTPLVWTSEVIWNNGRPNLSWEMHALPTGGLEKPGAVFEGITLNFWGGWGVNDLGQIAGDGWAYDPVLDEYWEIAVVWTPTSSRGWKIHRLPHHSEVADYPYTEALAINNRGEIVGDYWVCNEEQCVALPVLWKINAAGTRIGPLTVLATLSASRQGWNVAWGINDVGDIVGVSNDVDWNWLATRWKAKDASTATLLGFPGDWSVAFAVNNFGIAVGTYGVGEEPERAAAVAIH